ncbi:hypothetical protein Q7A53_03805 [Halobacillus rhizosphaerae]|uniref:hypothetical protein n=1 Tax=Halobacillus rhizosphaerae TaxID=3064889 RepID=UPI00398AC5A0
MHIYYSNRAVWNKKARGTALNTFTSACVLMVTLYLNGEVRKGFVYVTALLVLTGLLQTLHYLKMPEREYIRFEEMGINIRRGIGDPRMELADEDVKWVQKTADNLIIRTHKGDEETVYLENVKEEDKETILKEFHKRYGNRLHN